MALSTCSRTFEIHRLNIKSLLYGSRQTKNALEHAQDAQIHIILSKRKVSYGPLPLWYTMILLADSAGPDQTAPMPHDIFSYGVVQL